MKWGQWRRGVSVAGTRWAVVHYYCLLFVSASLHGWLRRVRGYSSMAAQSRRMATSAGPTFDRDGNIATTVFNTGELINMMESIEEWCQVRESIGMVVVCVCM